MRIRCRVGWHTWGNQTERHVVRYSEEDGEREAVADAETCQYCPAIRYSVNGLPLLRGRIRGVRPANLGETGVVRL